MLKYFLLVAREENITKAANLLHLTQPTLSRQLMQLEEELGVQLFRRSKHRIILTEEGMLLRRRAEEIVALADKTKDDLQHREEQLEGTIAVGSGELQSSSFLTKLLTAFQEKNPLVRFTIYSGNSDNIKERIERGLLDVGLLQEPVDITKYRFLRTPCREQWGVLVRGDSDVAAFGIQHRAGVEENANVLRRRRSVHRVFREIHFRHIIKLNISIRYYFVTGLQYRCSKRSAYIV